mmetsp:Transcript_17368/g.43261  ORF Transcript_17368/g.43261 Transcript_17368/m.43261 type:complete len:257 (-) Transcript_17368:1045-1815(-)
MPSACPLSTSIAASRSCDGPPASLSPLPEALEFFLAGLRGSASELGLCSSWPAASAAEAAPGSSTAPSAADSAPAPFSGPLALFAFFCFFFAALLREGAPPSSSAPSDGLAAASALDASAPSSAFGWSLPFLLALFLFFGALPPPLPPLPPPSPSSASSSSSNPIRSFSTSARSSCLTALSAAKSNGSRPSWHRIRTCAPCCSRQLTAAQQPLHAATHSVVLPSSSTALTLVPTSSSSFIDSTCPSLAALRRASSP